MMKTALLGFNTEELRALLLAAEKQPYRGNQLASWIYEHSAHSFDDMTNIPLILRKWLEGKYTVGRSQVLKTQRSTDGTIKLLLKETDGETIETVGIPYDDRFSCCVSTQVGCQIGCMFCATGRSGYKRNLSGGEIVDQVLSVQEMLKSDPNSKDSTKRIDHVVFMGMGEPLINYDSTVKAVDLLNHELHIGARSLTVSTVGFVPGIRQLMHESLQITLAVSLHASNDKLRNILVPGMSRYSLKEIVETCREYMQQTGRRITFEYCLLNGINDSVKDAEALAELLNGLNCHVNLIPYNSINVKTYRASPQMRIHSFREVLEDAGLTVTQRQERGTDISAACGQLRTGYLQSKTGSSQI